MSHPFSCPPPLICLVLFPWRRHRQMLLFTKSCPWRQPPVTGCGCSSEDWWLCGAERRGRSMSGTLALHKALRLWCLLVRFWSGNTFSSHSAWVEYSILTPTASDEFRSTEVSLRILCLPEIQSPLRGLTPSSLIWGGGGGPGV